MPISKTQYKKDNIKYSLRDNWISTYKRMKLYPYLTPYTKIGPKWIKNLNVTSKIIKLQGKNISINIHDLELGNEF